MTIAFTICANNYLAHATILARSFKEHHPNISFYIGIVDSIENDIDYENIGADGIIDVKQIMDQKFYELAAKFNVTELCTAVKPELIKFLIKEHSSSKIIYLDPDIEVFSSFEEVIDKLDSSSVVLTPHICSPTGDIGNPIDKDLKRTGIYNLGFIGLNTSNNDVISLLDWWDQRVRKYGFYEIEKGYFYDQIWVDYFPAFLDHVCILKHLGYNMANWNLHERRIEKVDSEFYVNSIDTPLRFFHYSNFKPENLPKLASYNENFTLDNREDVAEIFLDYKQKLLYYGYEYYKTFDYVYGLKPVKRNLVSKVTNRISQAYHVLLHGKNM